jgi:hypothetical protein
MNRREILKSSVLGIVPAIVGMNLSVNAQETEPEVKKENPFFEYFKNKHGFELHPYQKRYVDFLENSPEKLIIVRKPRQIGFSTLHYTWAEYRSSNYSEYSVISRPRQNLLGYLIGINKERQVNNYVVDEMPHFFDSNYGKNDTINYLSKILNCEEIKYNKLVLFSTPGRVRYKFANKNEYVINYSAKVFKELYYKFPKSVFNITHEDLKVCKDWNRVVKMSQSQQYSRGLYEMEVLGRFPTELI